MELRAATTVSLMGIMVCAVCVVADGAGSEAEAVGAVLDAFHRAASEADGDRYFGFFAEDAVFLGTDASERWSVEAFEAFARPYFSTGRGWTYTPQDRHVVIGADGATAWFDELLSNDAYGTCRGSGVLLLTGSGWRIAQYNLSIPIPNELAAEIVALIGAGSSQ